MKDWCCGHCRLRWPTLLLFRVWGQGCLLSSLPSDIVSNVTSIDFTCDLNNIAALWIRTLDTNAAHSICGQSPVALPALPETSGASLFIGHIRENILIMASCVVYIIAMQWEVIKS